MKPIAADFDGTFSDHPELKGLVDIIITGKSWENAQDLFDEAGDLSIPIFFNPVSSQENNANKIVLHKAEIINRVKAIKYYENEPNEAAQLKILCPNCKIILVKDGSTAI